MIDKKFDVVDMDRIMASDVDKLTPNELKLRLKALEEKISLSPIAEGKTKIDKGNLIGVGPDDLVTITMPAGPQGDTFNLNGHKYPPGEHVVKNRIAQDLRYRVSAAYKIERERLVSRSNATQSAILRGEDIARIERFENIMRED